MGPDLQRCSDLVFLMYYKNLESKRSLPNINMQGGSHISSPGYFIIPNIVIPATIDLFHDILESNNLVDDYGFDASVGGQGHKWDAQSESGKAIIGTLHGAAIAYFVRQHKQQFGIKVIQSVSFWYDNDTREWGMWAEIGDSEKTGDEMKIDDLRRRMARAR